METGNGGGCSMEGEAAMALEASRGIRPSAPHARRLLSFTGMAAEELGLGLPAGGAWAGVAGRRSTNTTFRSLVGGAAEVWG